MDGRDFPKIVLPLMFLVSFQTLFLSFAISRTPCILTIVYLASVSGDAFTTMVAATQGYRVGFSR